MKRKAQQLSDEVDQRFAPVIDAFKKVPEVGVGKMFSSNSVLNVNGKIFAMLARGKFVAKLPKKRVDELVSTGKGKRFDPGHGRVMKEWIAIKSDEGDWLELAREAYRFVKSAGQK
jgi:TfoX/Sxy family transcriptional regulator of competence genes